jgi:hypothetical protein
MFEGLEQSMISLRAHPGAALCERGESLARAPGYTRQLRDHGTIFHPNIMA